nr:hypothetical protein [Limnobaculum allomyrinae]
MKTFFRQHHRADLCTDWPADTIVNHLANRYLTR